MKVFGVFKCKQDVLVRPSVKSVVKTLCSVGAGFEVWKCSGALHLRHRCKILLQMSAVLCTFGYKLGLHCFAC